MAWLPEKFFKLNFLTISLGLPTCLKISIDLPDPTIVILEKFSLINEMNFFGVILVETTIWSEIILIRTSLNFSWSLFSTSLIFLIWSLREQQYQDS